ncbi:hypothetical protein [Nocardia testacea]|uniref:Uncharacterized protein n=1 Tax=Nocardia testacea TaxID=248551 RepID=A0ABW7VQJ2_9NOCA
MNRSHSSATVAGRGHSSSVLDDHPANCTGILHRDLEQRIAATGPELVTPAEQVRLIGQTIGSAIRFEEVEPPAARELVTGQGFPSDRRVSAALLRTRPVGTVHGIDQ